MSITGILRRARPLRLLMLAAVLLTVAVFHGLQCAQESFTAGHHRMDNAAAAPQHEADMTVGPSALMRSTIAALTNTPDDDSSTMLGVCLSQLATAAAVLLVQRQARLLTMLAARTRPQLGQWWGAVLPRAPSLSRLCVSRT
jgi:hypothetical protein